MLLPYIACVARINNINFTLGCSNPYCMNLTLRYSMYTVIQYSNCSGHTGAVYDVRTQAMSTGNDIHK